MTNQEALHKMSCFMLRLTEPEFRDEFFKVIGEWDVWPWDAIGERFLDGMPGEQVKAVFAECADSDEWRSS